MFPSPLGRRYPEGVDEGALGACSPLTLALSLRERGYFGFQDFQSCLNLCTFSA